VLLGFSGWPGAGKDTIPALLYPELGVEPAHVYFAVPLKDEGDRVIDLARAAGSQADAVIAVADEMGVSRDAAAMALGVVYEAAQDPEVHARTRTDAVRRMLHLWGTEVRRSQDPEYWVRRALEPAVGIIAEGDACYLSDVRFPNEVEWSRALGFHVVRLSISEATVRARLEARDGLVYDDERFATMMGHPAESSLNDFPDFDLVLDNEGTAEEAVAAVRAALEL
jgi:phosphomevalonate kinase